MELLGLLKRVDVVLRDERWCIKMHSVPKIIPLFWGIGTKGEHLWDIRNWSTAQNIFSNSF